MSKPFTGRHMTMILVGFFGVVFAVNFTMAALASSTFGGIVVENSYVASQHFNRWLDEAAHERALGWTATPERLGDGRVAVTLTGPGQDARLSGDARHPLGRLPDQDLHFDRDATGRMVSREVLPAGRWDLRLQVNVGGRTWRQEVPLS